MGYPNEMMGGSEARTITIPFKGIVLNPKMITTVPKIKYRKGAHKISEKIWVIAGATDANCTVIDAPEGLIVCDTGDNAKQGKELRGMIDAEIGKPVRAAICVHSHFFLGTGELGDNLMVIGHPNADRAIENQRQSGGMTSAIPEMGPMIAKRSAIQFNQYLPKDGPDAGLGVDYEFSEWATVPCTHTPKDGETLNVAGLDIQFFTASYSDDDCVTVYIPSLKTIASNNFLWGFTPNLYTLRGSTYRSPVPWLVGLKKLRELDAELLLGTATRMVRGKDRVRDAITLFMDNLALIYDQTCRGVLHGLTPDELRYSIYRPKHLVDGDHNSELYGCISWYPPAIYNYQLGWNDLDGARIFQLPPSETATRLIALMGGKEKVVLAAKDALDIKEYAWAAQLASMVQKIDPEHRVNKRTKADALRAMGQLSISTIGRAWLLTEALELEGKIKIPTLIPPSAATIADDPDEYVNLFRVRIDPRKSETTEALIAFDFGDAPRRRWPRPQARELCGLHIRKGVAEYIEHLADSYYRKPDVSIRISPAHWAELYLSKKTVDQVDIKFVTGNKEQFRALLALFDEFPIDVPPVAELYCDEQGYIADGVIEAAVPAEQ